MIYKKIKLEDVAPSVSEEAAREFIEHRVLKKCPLTGGAFKRAMKEASKAPERLGMSADWAILKTIDKGWQGINLEWLIPYADSVKPQSNFNKQHLASGNRSTRDISIDEQISNTDWAH